MDKATNPQQEAKAQAFKKKIKEFFKLFDSQSNETVDERYEFGAETLMIYREVGTIIRCLNIYPTEEQLSRILEDVCHRLQFKAYDSVAKKVLQSLFATNDLSL